jgi:hypothetical protein
MKIRTCVDPSGKFVYGIHKPSYQVANQRINTKISNLGCFEDQSPCNNIENFPSGAINVKNADHIFEIPNPFSFRGTTYIDKSWADAKAGKPEKIFLPPGPEVSFNSIIAEFSAMTETEKKPLKEWYKLLPQPLLLTLAATSTDSEDLTALAKLCCKFVTGKDGEPTGLAYQLKNKRKRAVIKNYPVFETLINNPCLPDKYKKAMVLRPGAQGGSEIVGEYELPEENSHVFEYLRRNSYIPWGHYASNMADDAVRYSIHSLSPGDFTGLRYLYYQRTFIRMADECNISYPQSKMISPEELEELRKMIILKVENNKKFLSKFNSTLWGWNFGFDFAPSGYRLHASHQQIHQQYALLSPQVTAWHNYGEKAQSMLQSYGCGDLISEFIEQYKNNTGKIFFDAYLKAIESNKRMDSFSKGEESLIIFEDDFVILFVPKAQTSQWELQLMTKGEIGNILDADKGIRSSLDTGIYKAMQALTGMGARMITTIEFPKRFDSQDNSQRLLYSFLPRLPESPGAFSEAQLRFINGHYPEDFAAACRRSLLPEAEK